MAEKKIFPLKAGMYKRAREHTAATHRPVERPVLMQPWFNLHTSMEASVPVWRTSGYFIVKQKIKLYLKCTWNHINHPYREVGRILKRHRSPAFLCRFLSPQG